MPYLDGRVIHDADAHTVEIPGFLDDYLEARFRPVVAAVGLMRRRLNLATEVAELERRREQDPDWCAQEVPQILW